MQSPSSSSPQPRFPVHLVTGPWGSGKSSLLNALLSLRPPNERWAVLLNELGRTPVGAETSPSSHAGVVVREAAGGCACCTGQVVFVTALATLIRQTRPERVFVECSSQANLPAVFHALHVSFAKVVTLESVIALRGSGHGTNANDGQNADHIVHSATWPSAPELPQLLAGPSRFAHLQLEAATGAQS